MTTSTSSAFKVNLIKTNQQKTNMHEENHHCVKKIFLKIGEWVMDMCYAQIGWGKQIRKNISYIIILKGYESINIQYLNEEINFEVKTSTLIKKQRYLRVSLNIHYFIQNSCF